MSVFGTENDEVFVFVVRMAELQNNTKGSGRRMLKGQIHAYCSHFLK